MTGTGAVIQWNQPWLPRGRQGRELTARGDRGGGAAGRNVADYPPGLGGLAGSWRPMRSTGKAVSGPRSLRERARRTRTRMVSLERPSDGLSPGRLGGDGDGSWLLEVIVWDWNGRDRTPLTTHRTRMAGWEPTSEAIDWKGSRRPPPGKEKWRAGRPRTGRGCQYGPRRRGHQPDRCSDFKFEGEWGTDADGAGRLNSPGLP